MNKLELSILEKCPDIEIMIRCFLHKHVELKDKIQQNNGLGISGNSEKNDSIVTESWIDVKKQIESYGVKKGDFLLVHSSMDGLAACGVSAKEVVDYLIDLLGNEGTLVFAAYPKCKPDKEDPQVLYYDPKRTMSWTGLLPNVFCRYQGVIRSEYPYNSLAARGHHAEEMMKGNLDDDLSQGTHSAWHYLVEHHAKILYLGVSAAMSCTMFNYPEDALGEQWYVKNWYNVQKYKIKRYDGSIVEKTIRERDPEWYRYYAMFYSEVWLKKNSFLRSSYVDGIYVGVTDDSCELAERLLDDARNHKSVYRIPRKYWK